MIKKIAIFVEGYTEQQFVIRLLDAIAGVRGVSFEMMEQFEGILHSTELRMKADSELYVLLVNCRNDSQVKSQIIKQHEKLTNSGYSKIVGLRDVYPHPISDLPLVRQFASVGLPTQGAPIDVILAVMEIEAWIVEELTHYTRINAQMTPDAIRDKGFDIIDKRGHEWSQPAEILNSIYSHWGLAYRKKQKQINRSIEALDLDELYLNVRSKSPSLDDLINSLEESLFA